MLTPSYHEADVTVAWDPVDRWVSAHWRNTPSRETVKKGCEEILKMLREKKATSVFNDNSEIIGAWGASGWVAEEWIPLMIAAGLRKLAWIESRNSTLSVISARRAARRTQGGIIRLFSDVFEAEQWLRA